jgi:hypothetical protein
MCEIQREKCHTVMRLTLATAEITRYSTINNMFNEGFLALNISVYVLIVQCFSRKL